MHLCSAFNIGALQMHWMRMAMMMMMMKVYILIAANAVPSRYSRYICGFLRLSEAVEPQRTRAVA